MPGPAPKPSSQRRRRNKPEVTAKLPAGERPDAEIPELPFADSANGFTLRWWITIWRSPMAAVWTATDELALIRMAQLVDQVAAGDPNPQVLAELRQMEDRFGLSPLARRRIGWEFDDATEKAATQADNVTDMKKWQRRLG